jgi:hypothetical protein
METGSSDVISTVFVRNAVPAFGIYPMDVVVGTTDTARAALDAILKCDGG